MNEKSSGPLPRPYSSEIPGEDGFMHVDWTIQPAWLIWLYGFIGWINEGVWQKPHGQDFKVVGGRVRYGDLNGPKTGGVAGLASV